MTAAGKKWDWTAAAIVLLVVSGCGPSNRAAVAGKVLLDGKPVGGGTISFVPTGDSASPGGWANIQGGDYLIQTKAGLIAGSYRVEIRWPRKTGKKFGPESPLRGLDDVVEAIPVRYHSQSELKAELKPGENRADFELKSK